MEMKINDDFDEWLIKALEDLDIDAEVYKEYVKVIISDEDNSLEERSQSIADILPTTPNDNLSFFQKDLVKKWEEKERKLIELKEVEIFQKKKEEQRYLEELKIKEQDAIKSYKEKDGAKKKQLSEEEIAHRARIVNEYGYNSISDFDEDGNLLKEKEKGFDDSIDDVTQNSNKQRVLDAQKLFREKAKEDHENKVKRDKELLEKDRLRKEKQKQMKKTQKKEKQRGCG